MTVYLANRNCINSVNEQVGTIYHVQATSHGIAHILNMFDSDGKIGRRQLLDSPSGKARSLTMLRRIIYSPSNDHKLKLRDQPEGTCNLNVFNEDELEFIDVWEAIPNKGGIGSVNKFREEHRIPEFSIDPDHNVISCDNYETLKKAIARIKSLKLTKLIFYNMLRDEMGNVEIFALFKHESEIIRRNLEDFGEYDFRDKFGFRKFVESNHRTMMVKVKNTTVDLATSIMSNILKLMKVHFMNWNNTIPDPERLCAILDMYEEVKILVVQVPENLNILNLMNKIRKKKVVVVTPKCEESLNGKQNKILSLGQIIVSCLSMINVI